MRYFSVQDANAFVPTLSAAFDDIARLRRHIAKVTMELALLKAKADADTEMANGDDAFEAMRICRQKIADAVTDIRAVVGEIESHGLIVKELDGCVDFRSRRGTFPVFLSWHRGEDQVESWHDMNTELTHAIDQRFEKAQPN